MSPFDRADTSLIETMCLSFTVFKTAGYLSKVADFDLPNLHLASPYGLLR